MRQSIEFQEFVGIQDSSERKVVFTKPTKEQPKQAAKTQHYRPLSQIYFYQHRDLPLFTFETIRVMLRDPMVRLCLAMRAAPIQSVEFAYVDGVGQDGKPNWISGVKSKNPVVAAWVMRQLQTIWNNFLPGILRSQTWGWAGGEVTLRLTDSNLLEIDQMLPRHARDVRIMELEKAGTPWGVQINSVKHMGKVELPFPYCYFVNFRPEDGERYSLPILLGAYSPWCDKWLNGGALDTRRLYMHKDAYGGMRVGYPEEEVFVDGNSNPIPARDVALQIVEQRRAGGVITYPSTRDPSGHEKWIIDEATVAANPQHILQYPKDLDAEIRQGMEIPDGAISNDGAGSWEGKSLPLAAFYSGLDTWVVQIICDLRQTLEPLARMNFGDDVDFEITHKPLAQTAMEIQGQKREGPDYGMGGMMGDPSGMMGDPSQPQRMSVDPVDAVGRGILSATNVIQAARTALGITTMAAERAPSGYTHDNPLRINGREYVGGQFIPGDQMQHASEDQRQEIKTGIRSGTAPKQQITPPDAAQYKRGPSHAANMKRLIASRRLAFKSGHKLKLLYDSKPKTRGYYVRHHGPDKAKTEPGHRFATLEEAADFGAALLHTKMRPVKSPTTAPESISSTKPDKSESMLGSPKNWRYTSKDFFSLGKVAKFNDNMAALRTLKTAKLEDRPLTKEEQEIVSRWVGWGQMPELFAQSYSHGNYEEQSAWWNRAVELKQLVGPEAFAAARASTTNGHYTHPEVIEAHWKMAKKLGFSGGRMLEPAVGAGYYLGFMPLELANKTHVTAIDMDHGSADVTRALYPSADVHTTPFQKHKTPDDYFDLVATNVPFDNDVKIFSPKHKMSAALHDYYFLRSVDTAKPGALIMQITSAGTMDKLDDRVRNYLDETTELVSAIRFPGDTHKANAGTEVVTDMLILRKKNPAIPPVTDETPPEALPTRNGSTETSGFTGVTVDSLGRLYHWLNGKRIPGPSWNDTETVPDPDGGEDIRVNRYFAERPENILGELDRTGTMYRSGMKNVTRTEDYEERLQQIIDDLPENIVRTPSGEKRPEQRILTDDRTLHEGQFVARDGGLYRHVNGSLVPLHVPATHSDRVLQMIAIKDAARSVVAKQRDNEDATGERSRLNELYDAFASKYGALHLPANRKLMADDPDIAFLMALEQYNSTKKTATKADIFSRNTMNSFSRATDASSVADAVGISLHETGGIDLSRIAALLGKTEEQIDEELPSSGLAFRTPQGTWQAAAIYLSGNTRQKLAEAKHAAKTDARFEANVRALENAQPEEIGIDDIGITLASPWVPDEVLTAFAAETLGCGEEDIKVTTLDTGKRIVEYVNPHVEYWRSNVDVWGDFSKVMESACGGKPIKITTDGPDGKTVVDEAATAEANERASQLRELFKDWAVEDDARAANLASIYNDKQNTHVETRFDGSHMTFPGMNDTFRMRDMQKDFVYRVIATGNGLAAHEVGTGKTSTMVAAAMELRRLNLAKKPAIAVKKANIEQFAAEAQDLYPGARILTLGKNFTANERAQTLQRIATGDYDMIILTHENLQNMKMRPATLKRFIGEELEELEAAIVEARRKEETQKSGKKKRRGKSLTKDLESRKQGLEAYLDKVLAQEDKDAIYFEDTGIDQLFVDEAHKFKSLPVVTRRQQVKGIPSLSTASARAMDMLARCRMIQEKNGGRGVVFATGTPITNTMAELYNMQRFLQFETLRERGVHRFDQWADTFGEMTDDLEYKLNGEMKATQRFARFINLPELRHLASEFMDVRLADDVEGLVRPNKHDRVVIAPESEAISDFMYTIRERAKSCVGGRSKNVIQRPDGTETKDSPLVINNDARAGSIDLRLVDPSLGDHENSKSNVALRNILQIYHSDPKATQAVFSDIGIHDTNKAQFSLFDDMRKKLVAAGIPAHEIVDFSDESMKDNKREEAQAALRRGEVRIAFGSTERLGTGTNIQTRLKALHHLDTPYVPAALEQRDGRAYRQKNEYSDIDIYKYLQEGSADHISWQILARKSGFINQYMRGDRSLRSMEDLDADSMTPEQMVAMATGDARLVKKLGVKESLRRLERLEMRHKQQQASIERHLTAAPQRRKDIETHISQMTDTMQHLAQRPDFAAEIGGSKFTDRAEADAALQAEKATLNQYTSRKLGSYKGLPISSRANKFYVETLHGDVEFGGTIRSLEAVLRNLPKRHEEAKQALTAFDTDTERLKGAKGQTFRHTQAIKDLRAELAELEQQTEPKYLPDGTMP